MKITFLGGADEVGASSTLIEIAGKRILVDAGIRPSPKARYGLAGDQLPHLDEIGALDAILVTHAHTDHTGALELVNERFPNLPVYATLPTMILTRVLHQDSRRIMQSRLDQEGELPLFDDLAVERLMSAFVPVPFRTRLPLGEGLAVTFFPAGHIAGAAMLGLESDEGNLLISGDISISSQRTVEGVRPPAFRPDLLILESTYGGRLHANRAVQERKLVERVAQVTAEGGKVLIPAFALGRAQEVLLILDEYRRRGELPAVPVWADGMVRAICQAYSTFIDDLPLALQERAGANDRSGFLAGAGQSQNQPRRPFDSLFFDAHIRPVQTNDQRNSLVWQPEPAVIVSSSGMLAGGPSLSYARSLAGGPQHAILLTGYQDEELPGRRLQQVAERGSGALRLGGDKVDVHCQLGTYSLSAHADEGQLISLVETLSPEHVLLVHGDAEARTSLDRALSARARIVHLPRSGQTFEFQFDARKVLGGGSPTADLRLRWGEKSRQRRQGADELSGAVGKWIVLKGQPPFPVRCLAVEADHLWVEIAPGLEQSVWPEDVLGVLGENPPSAQDLAPFLPAAGVSAPGASASPAAEITAASPIEPNQALAAANQQFPPQARLRKCGYRLAEGVLVLNFDFPDAAREQFAREIQSLQNITGWSVEVSPQANQAALNSLVREVLPEGWSIAKGPSIHRDEKWVAASARPSDTQASDDGILELARQRFLETSGYELDLTIAPSRPAGPPVSLIERPAEEPLEINTAYALIKTALENSTLYRTSLKGDEIVLSFISSQVGERHREQIETLARQVGWRLSINPHPNQGAILETARKLLEQAGWTVQKGPGIHVDKNEVAVTLADSPQASDLSDVEEAFTQMTGFRLAAQIPKPAQPATQVAVAGFPRGEYPPCHGPVERLPAKP